MMWVHDVMVGVYENEDTSKKENALGTSTYIVCILVGQLGKNTKSTIQDVDFNGILMEFTICWII